MEDKDSEKWWIGNGKYPQKGKIVKASIYGGKPVYVLEIPKRVHVYASDCFSDQEMAERELIKRRTKNDQ